jgi:hypothetical protein
MREIEIIFDVGIDSLLTSEGQKVRPNAVPYIIFREKPLVKLTIVKNGLENPISLPGGLTWSASIDEDMDKTNELYCKSTDSMINVNNPDTGQPYWDEADASGGKFAVRLDANNTGFQTRIGTKVVNISSRFELQGRDGNDDLVAVYRFPFYTKGLQDDSQAVPPEPTEDYLTEIQSDAKYAQKAPSNGNYRINNGTLELYNTTTSKWHSIWLEGNDGEAVLKWADDGVI